MDVVGNGDGEKRHHLTAKGWREMDEELFDLMGRFKNPADLKHRHVEMGNTARRYPQLLSLSMASRKYRRVQAKIERHKKVICQYHFSVDKLCFVSDIEISQRR